MKAFFRSFNALSSRREFLFFSEFLFFFERRSDARDFSFTRREADADAFSFARTFLWRAMNSLYNTRELEMRKTNSLSFFF